METVLRASALVLLLAAPAQRQSQPRQPLLMLEAEACSIQLTGVGRHARFGGRVSVYTVTAKHDGAVESVTLVERNFEALVKLDGFEGCIRRWRFGAAGVYRLTVTGGTVAEPAIQVEQGHRSFRLRIKYLENHS